MSLEVESRPQNVARGVMLIVMAALTISIQDVIFKLLSSNLTLWQIFALRGVLAIPLLLTASWMSGAHRGILRAAFGKWPLLRALFITTTFLAFYAAIPFLSLSTVGAANYIAPIFVTLLSAYVIKEAVGPLGWVGVLLGFVGVVVLLQPGTDAFSPWALLPIIGAAFYALAHITTRTRCQGVPPAALSLSQNTVMLLAGIGVSLLLLYLEPQGEMILAYSYIFGHWSAVSPIDWVVLLLLAGFAAVIGMMLAGAYQAAPPSTVATFEYSYLVFVAVWDILFFGIIPTFSSITGMVLVVAAGLLVLRR
ncbi:DMT family transporter [Shimia thalassica]|uniref:DMT family transporter n=1 Tax=Shimia thalassica TaxID=1715693 RepID=UPI001C08F376|nr:DMT family transporter [Shimia thalassica]MBU2941101.1 DMT family transporter [Shimia thalassica]MDO6503415.1 DMT family transporter [Shimia thalassica]